MLTAQPNATHETLTTHENVTIATQNVDGLHQKAGSGNVLELHGNIFRVRCVRRQCGKAWEDTTLWENGNIPVCPRCGRNARPDIVLFGETLPGRVRRAAEHRVKTCDTLIYAGTSGEVLPVAGWVRLAHEMGKRTMLFNAERWRGADMNLFDVFVEGSVSDTIPHFFNG